MAECKEVLAIFEDIEQYDLNHQDFIDQILELSRQCAEFGVNTYTGGDIIVAGVIGAALLLCIGGLTGLVLIAR